MADGAAAEYDDEVSPRWREIPGGVGASPMRSRVVSTVDGRGQDGPAAQGQAPGPPGGAARAPSPRGRELRDSHPPKSGRNRGLRGGETPHSARAGSHGNPSGCAACPRR